MKTIPLSQGKFAIVDDDDHSRISRHKWTAVFAKGMWKAYRKVKNKNIWMHREVLGLASPPPFVDHKDRNGLNNQKNNLRECTQTQNNANTKLYRSNRSGFKGVRRHHSGRFEANISIADKTVYITTCDTAAEAAIAYDKKAEEQWGDFALTNKKLGLL